MTWKPTEESEIRYVGDLMRLDVRPGDRFVLKLRDRYTMQQMEAIRDQLTRFLGDERPILILPDGMDLGVVGSAGNDGDSHD